MIGSECSCPIARALQKTNAASQSVTKNRKGSGKNERGLNMPAFELEFFFRYPILFVSSSVNLATKVVRFEYAPALVPHRSHQCRQWHSHQNGPWHCC